jgi:hypothetical protein
MNAKWGWIAQIGILAIIFLAGCRTPQPDLKPPKQAEVLNPPPDNVSPYYPKQAFNTDDRSKGTGLDSGFVPSRGSSAMTGTGMSPGGSMSPGGAGSFGAPR